MKNNIKRAKEFYKKKGYTEAGIKSLFNRWEREREQQKTTYEH